MRPNNPFVSDTGPDNEERTDIFADRFSGFDLIALQELFDTDQKRQIERRASGTFRTSRAAARRAPRAWSVGSRRAQG